MIPKKIHYCWFGGNPKPEIVEKCITSWHQYCPDWEIIEWNETNYDVTAHDYTKEAYNEKKWAFVSDVARLEVITKYGGIYLDTDVELLTLDPFADLLIYDQFLAFETERSINSGQCLGGAVGAELCHRLLESYVGSHYTKEKELVNSLTNKPVLIEMYPYLEWNGETQIVGNTYFMGIAEYCAKMKHHGTRSWCDDLPEYKISGFWGLKKFLRNPKIFSFLEKNTLLTKLTPIYEFLVYDFLDLGPIYYIKRLMIKLRKR